MRVMPTVLGLGEVITSPASRCMHAGTGTLHACGHRHQRGPGPCGACVCVCVATRMLAQGLCVCVATRMLAQGLHAWLQAPREHTEA